MSNCENHREHDRRLDEHEAHIATIAARVSELEQATVRTDEKVNQIFTILEKQELTLEKILTKVETLESKPAKNWESLIGILVAAAVTYFITKGVK